MSRAYSIHIGAGIFDEAVLGQAMAPVPGAAPSAHAMRDLAVAAGYDPIAVLVDREANLTNVVNALLRGRALGRGDRLLVTFAGHGASKLTKPEHWDESWCLYDGAIVDNEVNHVLCLLADRMRVTVVSDSCYSGTMLEMPAVRALQESVAATTNPMPTCSAILLAACADNRTAYAAGEIGRFTEALIAVWNGGAFQGGHQAFIDEIAKQTGAQVPKLWTRGAKDPAFLAARPFSPVGDANEAPAAAGTTVRVTIPIEVTITVGTPIVERG